MICEVLFYRTHHKNVAPDGSQNNPSKTQKIFTDSKSPTEKNFNGRKNWNNVEKIEKGFNRIHYSWNNCEKYSISWNMFQIQQFQFENPQIHQFEDKNGFIDSKDPFHILLWSKCNLIMGYLWIQTDHNLDHKCPDNGPPLTTNMYDQTMISLKSCCIYYGRLWSACFCT